MLKTPQVAPQICRFQTGSNENTGHKQLINNDALLPAVHASEYSKHYIQHGTYLYLFHRSNRSQSTSTLMKKALNMAHLGLAFVSFVGIILILQPSFLFGSSSTQH